MAGISSRAAGGLENKKRYNGNELQNKEFIDGSGLELYDFNARTYDHQIGRFIQIDPETEEGDQESLTPYHFSFNNPVLFSDPTGKFPFILPAIPFIIKAVAAAIGAAAGTIIIKHSTPAVVKGVNNVLQAGSGSANSSIPLLAQVGKAKIEKQLRQSSNNQGSGEGKGKNNRKPDQEATGDHTVSNDRGSTTYKKNDQNPSGFQEEKRVDTKGKPHNNVPTPHVHEDGKVRPANQNEMPKTDLSKNQKQKQKT